MQQLLAVALMAAGLMACGGLSAASAEPLRPTRDDCLAQYQPAPGQPGKDVVWLATPDTLVSRMLELAAVTAEDHVIDLGAGDGKIVIAAAKTFGATALGIEYEPELVRLGQCLVLAEGVEDRARIAHGDIFAEDFSTATVLTLFLLPQLNRCIRHRILAMDPGTRVVSHQFRMGEWLHDDVVRVAERTAYLWIVPARLDGVWIFKQPDGATRFSIDFTQRYQLLQATLDEPAGTGTVVVSATLRGADLRFEQQTPKGPATFVGTVEDDQISGTWSMPDHAPVRLIGHAQLPLRPVIWAEMFPGCERFYRW